MALSLVTGPSVEPVTLAEAKVHLRQDVADEDALITTLITAARQWTETFTHRALITQTWDLKLDDFPCDDADLELPLAPVASVTSISYVDTTGATQTWSASSYQTDLPTGPQAQRGRIAPAYAQYYPVPRSQLNAVTVRFVAGYGATGATVPESIRAAIKLMVGHWFERRTPVHIGNLVMPLPLSVESLLWPYKAF
jgi:uncharacterized phiE125 gp8 family phage protein